MADRRFTDFNGRIGRALSYTELSTFRGAADCGRKSGVSRNRIMQCENVGSGYIDGVQSQRLKIKMSLVLDSGRRACP